MDYSKCILNSEDQCGAYKRLKPPVQGLFSLAQLDHDILPHLVSCKVKKPHEDVNGWNELKLIENRLGKTLENEDKLCAYHRFINGVGWRPSKRCQHPLHNQENRKKSPATRPIPIETSISIANRYKCYLPIGSVMCFNHLKDELSYTTADNVDESVVIDPDTEVTNDSMLEDPDFEPEEIIVADDVLNSTAETSGVLSEYLDASPVRFQIKRKRVDDLSENTKLYLKRKYEEAKNLLAQKFAEGVAPGQSEEFRLSVLECSNENENPSKVPDDLKRFLDIYKNSDTLSQIVILALLDHENYSKTYITDIFECSRYKVDQARKWKACNAGLVLPEKTKFKRSKLNIMKCEHFLDFIFTSGLLQDVAFGVTKVKFDSGEEQKIAHAILTTKFSHTIAFYLQSCIHTGKCPFFISQNRLSNFSLLFVIIWIL